MKKWALLLCMVMAAMLLSGCALVEKDEAVDMLTPIVSLGDFSYNKSQVLAEADYEEYMYAVYYGYTGIDRSLLIDSAVETLKQEVLKEYMIQKLGLDQLTAEEQATLDENAKASIAQEREYVKGQYFAETELAGDELEKAIDDKMVELGATDEAILAQAKSTLLQEKLNHYVTDEVTVSEEEAKANYDETVAAAKTNYETNLNAFGSSYNAGSQIYYTPAGYRNIKNLLVAFKAEDSTAISDAQSQVTAKETAITSTQEAIDQYTGELDEEQQAALDSLNTDLNVAQSEKAAAERALATAMDTAYANIAQTIVEIREKLAAGEKFEDLMAQYGSDSISINQTTGYAICEGFTGKDSAFVEAAMALKAIGDTTSEDVKASNGISILSYAADISEGEVGFENVKDLEAITKLSEKKNNAYSEQLEKWLTENPVKVDRNAMN